MADTKYITDPYHADITDAIVFSITNRVYDELQKGLKNHTVTQYLQTISTLGNFLISKSHKQSEHIYSLYFPDGVLRFTEAEQKEDEENNCNYVLTSFQKNSLDIQNEAMRYGMSIRFKENLIFRLRLTKYNCYIDIRGKEIFQSGELQLEIKEPTSFQKALKQCTDTSGIVPSNFYSQQKTKEEEEELERERLQINMPREMEKLLDTAENYAELASQIEQEKARSSGKVLYSEIHSVVYEQRADRVCYEFVLLEKGLDETVFKQGSMIEFSDQQEETHSAEIVNMIREDPDDEESPVGSIYALFTDQIDIDSFSQQSGFTPSYSDVNKEVQEAAIERIRTFQSSAASNLYDLYNDDVAKTNAVIGLDRIVQKLQEKKYPPNESQVHAITEAIKTQDMYLVMGPPGTGKTTVILEWVKYFVLQAHMRVLVSSKNNKAVDNVLARLAEEKGISTIRIGSEAKLQEDVRPYMFENRMKTMRQEIIEKIENSQKETIEISKKWNQCAIQIRQYIEGRKKALAAEKAYKEASAKYSQDNQEITILQQNADDCSQRISDLEQQKESMQIKLDGMTGLQRLMKPVLAPKIEDSIQETEKQIAYLTKLKEEYISKRDTAKEEFKKQTLEFYLKYKKPYEQELKLHPKKDLWHIADFPLDQSSVAGMYYTLPRKIREGRLPLNDIIEEIDTRNKRAEAYINVTNQWKQCVETQQNYALENLLLDSVDLVGATCIGIQSKKRFKDMRFDVTIIDEAGQIQVHDALVPLSLSPKFIMLGDQKQIPPMADPELVAACEENNVDTTLLKKSLFEVWYAKTPDACKIMLDTQYRMPGDIADTISEWFYDGKYISPPFKRKIDAKDLMLPSLSDRTYLLIDTSEEPNRHEYKIPGKGSSNELEAEIAADLVRIRLHDIKGSNEQEKALHEIGVISAYKAQVKLIRQKLSGILPDELVREMAASLDSFQGQERDLIIYSFTKSSESSPNQRRIGFLNELRRLNVAMSRCKKGLVMIGDMQFLQNCRHMDQDEDGNDIYEQSEKQFSDFVRKMYTDVTQKNRGQRFTYQEFHKRCEEILNHDSGE